MNSFLPVLALNHGLHFVIWLLLRVVPDFRAYVTGLRYTFAIMVLKIICFLLVRTAGRIAMAMCLHGQT